MGHCVNIFAGPWTLEYDHRSALPVPAALAALTAALREAGLDIVVGAPEDADKEPFDDMVAQNEHLLVEVTTVEHRDGIAGFELETTADADSRDGPAAGAYLALLNKLLSAAATLGAGLWDDDTQEPITVDTVAEAAAQL